jgi:hypothetical protein
VIRGAEDLHGKAVDAENPGGAVLVELLPAAVEFPLRLIHILRITGNFVGFEGGEGDRSAIVQRYLEGEAVDRITGDRITVADIAVRLRDHELAIDNNRLPLREPALVVEIGEFFQIEDALAVLRVDRRDKGESGQDDARNGEVFHGGHENQ